VGVTDDSRESYLQILKDSPCLARNMEAKSQLWMKNTAHQKNFKSVCNMGCLRLEFLLPTGIESR
jgi:hypothetical protein